MRKWRIEDSEELYNITGWGTSYFSINDKGHVVVTPRRDGVTVDLKELVDELQLRDVASPMLLRFPDILDNRIEKMSSCFKQAAEEYGYKAENFIIYPIKVNQMRPVVEEIISHGKKIQFINKVKAHLRSPFHILIIIRNAYRFFQQVCFLTGAQALILSLQQQFLYLKWVSDILFLSINSGS